MFRRWGPVWALTVKGRTIESTPEHPFYVLGKKWVPLNELRPGDAVRLVDGWGLVESVADTGRLEFVYNCRVADYHTYFVGDEEWGFAVWVHNHTCSINAHAIVDRMGYLVSKGVSGASHLQKIVAKGYPWAKFQAIRAIHYYKAGKLHSIEAVVGKAGRVDILLKGKKFLVEVKHWTGWQNRPLSLKQVRLNQLEDQIKRYLRGPTRKLRVEFRFNGAHYPNKMMPPEILQRLEMLKQVYGARLKWRVT